MSLKIRSPDVCLVFLILHSMRMKTFEAAIKEAAIVRFSPIIMTSLTTAAGSVSLILSSGAGAETRAAIGYVILFGVIAAAITVIFVPTAYAFIARGSKSAQDVSRELEAQSKLPKTKRRQQPALEPAE